MHHDKLLSRRQHPVFMFLGFEIKYSKDGS
jgi:hypothetical protein